MPDTKMRPIRTTIPLDEALAILDSCAVPIARTEVIPLADANGRVLASSVVATADVPPFDSRGHGWVRGDRREYIRCGTASASDVAAHRDGAHG